MTADLHYVARSQRALVHSRSVEKGSVLAVEILQHVVFSPIEKDRVLPRYGFVKKADINISATADNVIALVQIESSLRLAVGSNKEHSSVGEAAINAGPFSPRRGKLADDGYVILIF